MIGAVLTIAGLVASAIVCGRIAAVLLLPRRSGPASPYDGRSTLAPDRGPIEPDGGDAGRARLRSLNHLEAFDLEPADLEHDAS